MFTELPDPGRNTRYTWRSAALVLQVTLIVAVWAAREKPIFVQPSSIAQGNGSRNITPLYFAPGDESNARPRTAKEQDSKLRLVSKPKPKLKTRPMQQPVQLTKDGESGDKPEKAGTVYGSLYSGAFNGHDVRPAYPVVFPNPPVSRDDFPPGFQGDVVVEVTIDTMGHVIDAKLLNGIHADIDQKVVATVQNWKFKPAMMDGRPIASKHDVRFHFPS